MNKYAYFKMMKIAEDVEAAKDDKESRKAAKKEEKAYRKMVGKETSSGRLRSGGYQMERWGGLTSTLTTSAVLAAIGAILGGKSGAALGALGGGAIGAGAHSIGQLVGDLAGPRKLMTQTHADRSLANQLTGWLVPGVAGWNRARTRATADEERAMLRERLLNEAAADRGLTLSA